MLWSREKILNLCAITGKILPVSAISLNTGLANELTTQVNISFQLGREWLKNSDNIERFEYYIIYVLNTDPCI